MSQFSRGVSVMDRPHAREKAQGRISPATWRDVNRLTFGATPYEMTQYSMMGRNAYIEQQLRPESIDDSSLDAYLAANYPALLMTPLQLSQQPGGDPANQLARARLMRAIFSKRQLLERLVECWTDHFNIWIKDDSVTYMKVADDRDVIRAFALSTFPELLSASAHSPAMLSYLNNDTNKKAAPNENYARELMELHTLSVSGPYTQADVQQVAKCFTGWTYYGGTSGIQSYTYRFDSTQHDTTQKIVLGNIIPARTGNSGQQDGETVLQILATHPSTARMVATKLLRHFYGYDPGETLIGKTADIYLQTSGDIKSMLRFVLAQALMPPYQQKFKRPMHLVVSMLRALNATVTATNNLQTPLTEAGQAPFDWQPPDGFPDSLAAWTGLMLARWNFGARLMANTWYSTSTLSGITVDHVPLVGTATTASAIVKALNANAFANTLTANEQAQLISYLGTGTVSSTKIREAIGLAVSVPSFQWY